MKKTILFAIIIAFVSSSFAQKITKLEGDLKAINTFKKYKLEFVYDENMSVGKLTEAAYIADRRAKYEEKHPGEGDVWEDGWKNARIARYAPKFEELFNKGMAKKDVMASVALDTYDAIMVVHTYFIEPGFNVGIMKKPSLVSWYVIFKDKEGKQLLKLDSKNAPGVSGFGGDFDASLRIAESYAKGAKTLAKYLSKKAYK